MSGTSTSRRLAGVAVLTVDGNPYDVVSDAAYDVALVKRETLGGQTRIEGYSEMPKSGSISAKIRDNSAFSVRTFNDATDVTVTLMLANGKAIYGNGMWCTECSEVATMEGSFSVKFESDDVSEGAGF